MAMAAAGANVVVNDLGATLDGEGEEKTPADQVVDEILTKGGTAITNYGSVADWDQAHAMIDQAVEAFGQIDILVNVAGILRDRMLFNMTEAEWDAVLAVHLKGMFNCTQAASIRFRVAWIICACALRISSSLTASKSSSISHMIRCGSSNAVRVARPSANVSMRSSTSLRSRHERSAAGAAPLAMALRLRDQLAGRRVVLVASGGNASLEQLRDVLAST